MTYLFDTNILLNYLRESPLFIEIESRFSPFQQETRPIISVVSVGELRSIALQNGWGHKKTGSIEAFFQQFLIADINYEDVILAYAEIDAFSQRRHPTLPLPISARNMGKNDLWIAATASVLGAVLLTTDRDFDHLNSHFLQVESLN